MQIVAEITIIWYTHADRKATEKLLYSTRDSQRSTLSDSLSRKTVPII